MLSRVNSTVFWVLFIDRIICTSKHTSVEFCRKIDFPTHPSKAFEIFDLVFDLVIDLVIFFNSGLLAAEKQLNAVWLRENS